MSTLEAVILLEFAAGDGEILAALLDRIGALASIGRARLVFVGREAAGDAGAQLVAIDVADGAAASALLERWRGDGVISDATPARILSIRRMPEAEPLGLLFP